MREIHAMAAPAGSRRYESRLALNFFIVHATILPETVGITKTYRRFLGTIFWGGAGTLQVVSHQGLARQKNTKNEKTQKKCLFFARTPRFSAKQARFGAVFCCQTIAASC
jgi:hypothetical protein